MAHIYCDTSVLGGCFDDEFKEWSLKLFKEFQEGEKILVISDITLEELERAPVKVRDILHTVPNEHISFISTNNDVEKLAKAYIKEKIITKNYYQDCRHIALVTIHKVDVLVSWNFKHIVNYNKIRHYNAVNLKYGYGLIDVRTPREVLNEKG